MLCVVGLTIKCYVMWCGVGWGIRFPEKKMYEGVWVNVISFEQVGGCPIPGKKCYLNSYLEQTQTTTVKSVLNLQMTYLIIAPHLRAMGPLRFTYVPYAE